MHPQLPTTEGRTLSTGEVAKLIGIDRSTLLRWLRQGLLPDVERTATNYRMWRPDDVRRALAFWRWQEQRRIEHCRTARRKSGERSSQ